MSGAEQGAAALRSEPSRIGSVAKPKGRRRAAAGKCRGLVVLDVDGVLFRGQLMIALTRRRGLRAFLQTMLDCFLFDVGRIELEGLLRRTYGRLRRMSWQEVWDCYHGMELAPHCADTIEVLKASGLYVLLLTAGVPDPVVKDLAVRLGADEGAGMHVVTRDGRLTGEVAGELAHGEGKLLWAGRVAERESISWRDVIVVGDDRNNLPLMRKAGKSIGFHSTHLVRKEAHYLIDEDDLSAILPYATGRPAGARRRPRPDAQRGDPPFWRREVLRKAIHMTFMAVPFLASRFPIGTSLLLVWGAALYLVLEFCRVNGAKVPLVHWLVRRVMRRHERRVVAMGPLTLALGAFAALWGLPLRMALACILIAAVSDSISAVVGSRWGHVPWPHNRLKTIEGSVAFFVSAVVCAAVYLRFDWAVRVAVIATLVESLPAQDWDNFLTPVVTGCIATVLMRLWG